MSEDLEKRLADMKAAREKANKATDRAYWALTIALWVNLINLGFQVGLLIGRHTGH
jgi:hypothetical protein